MEPENTATEMAQLREMKEMIEGIDHLARKLANIGKGLPVIEKTFRVFSVLPMR